MIIKETSIFTRRVQLLLDDEEYRELQIALLRNPAAGALIPGSGGLRKVRWSIKGRGKRGGVRTIYYWAVSKDEILMLFIYAKNEQDDLSSDQLKTLQQVVEEEYS